MGSRFNRTRTPQSINNSNLSPHEGHPQLNMIWSMLCQFFESVKTKAPMAQLAIGTITGYLSAHCFKSVSQKLAYGIGFGILISEIYSGESWTLKLRLPSMSISKYIPTTGELMKCVRSLGTIAVGFIAGALISLAT